MESELGYRAAGLGMLVCLLASFLWPWVTKRANRPYQVGRAAGWALAATVLFFAYSYFMPSQYNIRVDLIVLVPALAVVWLQCLILALVRRQSAPPTPRDA